MTDAPKRMWRENIRPSQMYPDGGSFYHETATAKPADEYHRANLSADLVRAALEAAESIALQGDSMEGHGAIIAKDIRALAKNPEAVAAIVARVMEKETT